MKIEIKEIKNKDVWENFLLEIEEKTFLQSWPWGEFNKKMGHKIWRLGIFDKNNLIATALVAKIRAKRGIFLLLQHGPNIKNNNHNLKFKVLQTLSKTMKEIAREENCSFIRMNPLWKKNEEHQEIINKFSFQKAPMHANAYEATWKLDIGLSEEKLLENMRKSTRYLIRQSLKDNKLQICKSRKEKDLKIYHKFNQEVARYQQFVPFPFDFIKNEFSIFLEEDQILLFFGKYQDKIIASALIVFWSKTAFYHQAALSPSYRKIPVAYLLQWQAIKEAKKRNCAFYDFWGYIDPKKKPQHPWAGPSLFKMGFGGKAYQYLETYDLPLSKKYWLIFIFEKLRKIKRRL